MPYDVAEINNGISIEHEAKVESETDADAAVTKPSDDQKMEENGSNRKPELGIPGPDRGVERMESSVSLMSDGQLESMKVIFRKELPKISVDRYYQTFWTEESNSFFKSWLSGDGKSNVEVGPWRFSSDSGDKDSMNDPYDKELYDQVRTVTYCYNRSTSVYSGKVSVTMTQYCRRSQRSRCVVASTLQFSGMPYAKSFQVHIRWVATRRNRVNLRVQVGVDVVFSEQVLVAGQIKANALNEMTQAQLSLFRKMKNALGVPDTKIMDLDTDKKKQNPIEKGVAFFFPFSSVASWTKNGSQMKVDDAFTKLTRVRDLPLKESASELEEQRDHIMDEMDVIHTALDAILLRKYTNMNLTKKSSYDSPVPGIIEVGQGIQYIWEALMRKLSPRTVHIRDPSAFVIKRGIPAKPEVEKADETLKKMEVVVSSSIAGASLEEFADTFLSDEDGQNRFYADWLRQTDRRNIEITSWEDKGKRKEPIVDTYSGETFQRCRTVRASFDKAKFSQDQSPSIEATQTQEQFYRMVKGQQLVFSTSTRVENIPFSSSFIVHTRWVVTQLSSGDLSVKIGLAVVFNKQGVLLEPKIRAGTTREGRRTQISLLLKIRSSLGKAFEERTAAQKIALAETLTPAPRLIDICSLHLKDCSQRALGDVLEADQTLHEEFENTRLKLRSIRFYIREREGKKDWETLKFVLGELNVVSDALDNIVDWHGESGDGKKTLDAANLL